MSPYYLQNPENQCELLYTACGSVNWNKKFEDLIFTLSSKVEDAQNKQLAGNPASLFR